MGSVIYVMALIGVFNFIIGVASINYLSENDMFHFGTVRDAMTTLYRIETLQAWEQVLYVSMFGCDRYYTPATEPFQDESCEIPFAAGYAVMPFFIFVVVFGSLVMPTLLVAVITAGTKESFHEVEGANLLDERVSEVVKQYPEVFGAMSLSTK